MAKNSLLNQQSILESTKQIVAGHLLRRVGLPEPFGQIAALFIRETEDSAARRLANSIGSGAVKLSEVQYYATSDKVKGRDKRIAKRAIALAKK